MLQQFCKEYLDFTKKERNGIYVLLLLIVVVTIMPFFYPLIIQQKKYDHLQFQQDIAMLQLKQADSNAKFIRQYAADDNEREYNSTAKEEDNNFKGELFYFDPNTLSVDGWRKLGVKEKTITTIQKYLSKGGKFYKPEDIGKIWGLKEEQVARLTPYIRIEQAIKFTEERKESTYNRTDQKYKSFNELVDINSSDTTAWIRLPGIGSKLANRIIGFRDKLGGFYSIEQVAETFGLADSTYQKIKSRLAINNLVIKQFNINTATIDELKTHPYIRYAIANAIVQYRAQHGNFRSIDEIKKIMTVTEEMFNKLKPYLKVNE